MRCFTMNGSGHHPLFVLLLLGVLVRLAIPTGFMLAPGSTLAFVPCEATIAGASLDAPAAHAGMHHDTSDTAAGEPERSRPHGQESGCAFTALSVPGVPPSPPQVSLPAQVAAADLAERAAPDQVLSLIAAPPPPARGPPLLI